MNKVILEAKPGTFTPILVSHPVVLAGANVDGKPNFAAVAWVGVAASYPPAVTIALQHHRYTLKGIRQNMTFSVNIPFSDLLKEADYCGLVSGAKTDKVKDTGFKIFFGSVENAPLIEQCPVNHACEVVQILSLGSHELIVGRIKETHVSPEYLKNGRLDVKKINPLLYASNKYFAMGKCLADAFEAGSVIAPKKAKEGVEQFRKRQPRR